MRGVIAVNWELRRMVSPGTAGRNARKIQAFEYPFTTGLVIPHTDERIAKTARDYARSAKAAAPPPQPQNGQRHVRQPSGSAGSTYRLPLRASCRSCIIARSRMNGVPAAQSCGTLGAPPLISRTTAAASAANAKRRIPNAISALSCGSSRLWAYGLKGMTRRQRTGCPPALTRNGVSPEEPSAAISVLSNAKGNWSDGRSYTLWAHEAWYDHEAWIDIQIIGDIDRPRVARIG